MSKRPNILLIMTDQQTAGALSCVGNPHLHTPAMDSIAERGIVFELTYCAQPLCVPSRTSMMTGRMPHEMGVSINMSPQPDLVRVPMLGALLSEGGYDCRYVGKWHLPVPKEDYERHGFSFTQDCKDQECAEISSRLLAGQLREPFFLVSSFRNPHDTCQWARGEELPQGPIGEPPAPDNCPPLPDNFSPPAGEPEAIRDVQPSQPRLYPSIHWDADKWRQYRWAYYRLVEKVDAQIAMVLDTLRKNGTADNTLVVFLSDHGDGAAGHSWNQKQVLYDEPTRVPFILCLPGLSVAGVKDRQHLVSTGLDLLPTLCDCAGVEAPPGLRGRSLRPLVEDRGTVEWRDSLVVETTFCGMKKDLGLSGRMLRTNRFKYVVYSRGNVREQLFDMEDDPGETQNLATAPESQAILQERRRLLSEHLTETDDQFRLP